jgi:hypothetical protein
MQIATTEFVLAWPSIKAILIQAVVQNVFLIQIVQETKHAYETNALTLVQGHVVKTLYAMLSTMFRCAVVQLEWQEMRS